MQRQRALFLIVFVTYQLILYSAPIEITRNSVGHLYGLSNANGNPKYNPAKEGLDLFEVVSEWKYLDFEYPTYSERKEAISNGSFIPENNLPLGVDFYANRIFVTTPRWKEGVPASLGYIEFPPQELSPSIRPYPTWAHHGNSNNPDCSKLMSVYRTAVDSCGRLWVIDAGIINAITDFTQICPPKIVAFDLSTDKEILKYELPPDQVKQDSLHSNIAVDIRGNKCQDAYVYVTDVWRFGIVVYSLRKGRSWRVTNFNFSPNPQASNFNIYGLNFQWLDGIFGLSLELSEGGKDGDRLLYFHPMASYKEFIVSTSLLRDESIWANGQAQQVAKYFIELGDRGLNSQSSTSAIARNGVMLFTQVHRDTLGCWDTAKPYTRSNLFIFSGGNMSSSLSQKIQFPNDLKIDLEPTQHVWVMSNRLPIFLYSQLDNNEINFRILRANVLNLIKNTICDSKHEAVNQVYSFTVYEGQCF